VRTVLSVQRGKTHKKFPEQEFSVLVQSQIYTYFFESCSVIVPRIIGDIGTA
jgi:hypothetical protein